MARNRLDAVFHLAMQLGAMAGPAAALRGCCIGPLPQQITVRPLPPDAGVPDGARGWSNDRTLSGEECVALCGNGITQCRIVVVCEHSAGSSGECATPGSVSSVGSGGVLAVECWYQQYCGPGGRRPEGYASASTSERTALGTYLSQQYRLEHASIGAFVRARREWTAHRAPRALLRACARAEQEEREHARVLRALARSHGASTRAFRARRSRVRPLPLLAIENAVEGCVRETFGALLARWQAMHARDKRIATTFARLARDETRHARLSWSFAFWSTSKLNGLQRQQVSDALTSAVRALRSELETQPSPAVRSALGLPSLEQARALVDTLDRALWKPFAGV